MNKKGTILIRLLFFALTALFFPVPSNAQLSEKFIKKLPGGLEVYQRKARAEITRQDGSEKIVQTSLKVEAVLKENGAVREIIWSKEIFFEKDALAFNLLNITDICQKGNDFYLLYYAHLELRVAKLVKKSGGWQAENDTFLAETSESVNPLINSGFVNNKTKVTAKRDFSGVQFEVYEWILKKDKWVLKTRKLIKSDRLKRKSI